MLKKIMPILSAVVLIIFLSSCLGVEMSTEFNADGSGTSEMKIFISQMLLQMGDEAGSVPFPLTKESAEETWSAIEGITLINVTEQDTEEDKIITIKLAFRSMESLTGSDLYQDSTLKTVGGVSTFRTVLREASEDDGEGENDMGEMEEMVRQFYEGYNFEYTVKAPRRIRSHNLGVLALDGRSVTYSKTMYDFSVTESGQELILEVSW